MKLVLQIGILIVIVINLLSQINAIYCERPKVQDCANEEDDAFNVNEVSDYKIEVKWNEPDRHQTDTITFCSRNQPQSTCYCSSVSYGDTVLHIPAEHFTPSEEYTITSLVNNRCLYQRKNVTFDSFSLAPPTKLEVTFSDNASFQVSIIPPKRNNVDKYRVTIYKDGRRNRSFNVSSTSFVYDAHDINSNSKVVVNSVRMNGGNQYLSKKSKELYFFRKPNTNTVCFRTLKDPTTTADKCLSLIMPTTSPPVRSSTTLEDPTTATVKNTLSIMPTTAPPVWFATEEDPTTTTVKVPSSIMPTTAPPVWFTTGKDPTTTTVKSTSSIMPTTPPPGTRGSGILKNAKLCRHEYSVIMHAEINLKHLLTPLKALVCIAGCNIFQKYPGIHWDGEKYICNVTFPDSNSFSESERNMNKSKPCIAHHIKDDYFPIKCFFGKLGYCRCESRSNVNQGSCKINSFELNFLNDTYLVTTGSTSVNKKGSQKWIYYVISIQLALITVGQSMLIITYWKFKQLKKQENELLEIPLTHVYEEINNDAPARQ